MSDDTRPDQDQPETELPESPRPELTGPPDEAIEAEAASTAAASDTFDQAGGAVLERVIRDHAESASPATAKLERLQKILAKAGIASRRHAEELITGGRVQVNGKVVTELGSKADPAQDHIRVDGKLLQGSERHRYFMLNKPKGFVTTVSDPEGRPTIMQFFAKMRERLYPVGRLDYMSEGLLLVTNDGELANKLTRAVSGVEKTYLVKVSGQPTEEELEQLREGISIDRGKPGSGRVHTAPAQIRRFRPGRGGNERQAGRPTGANPWFEVTLVEGRNRELRKMFEEIGRHVEKIRRIGYGPLVLDLEPGKFRELEPEEVENLRKAGDGKYHKPKSREPRQRSAAPQTGRHGETPRWDRRPTEGTKERGKFRREGGHSFGAERNRATKPGQFGSGNRSSEGRFQERREDRPPRRDRGDRPFGESRERRGRFAGEQSRPHEGKFKHSDPRKSRPNFANAGDAGVVQPERQRFGRGDRKPFGQRKPFRRDVEDQPRFDRPRRDGGSGARTEERGERRGPQKALRRDREERPRFDRPRRESGSEPRTEARSERSGPRKPFRQDREGDNRFNRPPRDENRNDRRREGGNKGRDEERSSRPAGRSSTPRSGSFNRGKAGAFRGKSGSVRSGGRRRPGSGSRPGSRPGGKPGGGKRRP